MQVLAHRGYHKQYPENTLNAFSEALKYPVDGIETDVRLTADNIPVLYHDRFTVNFQPVSDLSRTELEQTAGFPVPTLTEALDRFRDILWNIEIKNKAAVLPTINALKHFSASHRILVTSFFHDILPEIADALSVDCGALIAHNPLDYKHFIDGIRGLDKRITTIVLPAEFLSEANVTATQNAGMKTAVYDVCDKSDMAFCRDLDVDTVITDHPDSLL